MRSRGSGRAVITTPTRALPLSLLLAAVGCATGYGEPELAVDGPPGGSGSGGSAPSAGGSAPSAGRSNPSAAAGQPGAPSNGGGSGAVGVGGSMAFAGSASVGGSTAGRSSTAGRGGAAGSGGATPVSVGLPFSEDFEGGAIAPGVWTAVAKQIVDPTTARWKLVSDGASQVGELDSDGSERFLVGGNGAWTDQRLELRVKVVSGDPEIDIAFRYHAVKDYYYLEFADSHFKLRDRAGSNADVLPTGDKPALVTGTWYKITLQIKGVAVSGALDDVVIASGTFPSMPIAAGGIAIGVGSGSGVVRFDDIKVTAP